MISAAAWQGFIDAWRAEWTKTRTLTSTGRLLAAGIAAGIGLSAAVCAIVPYQPGAHQDPAKLALTGIQLTQALLAIWAVRAICGEYRTGMIRTTLTAIPRRTNLLAAKTAVTTVLVLAAGTITVGGSLLIARTLLTADGFTASHHVQLALGSRATLRAGLGSILYLALIGLLSSGIALALRDAAAATGILLGLLYLFPLAAQLTGDTIWQRVIQQVGPTTAGLNIQATSNLTSLPISPWAGLAVLAAWSMTGVLLGALALQNQDQ